MRSHGMTRRWAAALVVPGLLALGACSDDDSPGPGSTTEPTTITTGSTTTPTTVEDAVLTGYRQFWDTYLEAADPMDPMHPGLDDVATGEELSQVRNAFLARSTANEVVRGELDLAPKVTGVAGSEATVTDCYMDRTGIYDATTGERKDVESGVRHLVTVQLVHESSAWKVASMTRESDGCTPGADS